MALHELAPHSFHRVEPLFTGREQHVPVRAVTQHRFPGKVYVDDLTVPRSALVWALTRWAYVAGDPHNTAFLESLPGWLERTVFPERKRMLRNWFEIYAPPNRAWESGIEQALAGFAPEKHYESTFRFDPARYRKKRSAPQTPPGLTLQLRRLPLVPEIATSSGFVPRDFIGQTSPGFELADEHRVIAVCRSNGFQAGDAFLIDVQTHQARERGQGYATLTATALVDWARKEGLTPLWEATQDNAPSRRLAEKLGFVDGEPYPVYGVEIPSE